MAKTLSVGSKIVIPAGTKVTRLGTTSKRSRDTQVTVRNVVTTKTGKTKVSWKSDGYTAQATI